MLVAPGDTPRRPPLTRDAAGYQACIINLLPREYPDSTGTL